jgi:glycylpeptide N-tetradecanoyltransferase
MDHYVEDEVGNFRLYYTVEKLRWGVKTPGMIKDLNFLIRNSKNKKILASLVACPKKIVINGQTIKMAEVNFLAVHKKLRSKRLA